jgi:hypothetical protein
MTEGSDKRLGDVTKLWLTTPTYNVMRQHGAVYNATMVIPREGFPGWIKHVEDDQVSLYTYVLEDLPPFLDGERFVSGVIEFDTEDQIRFAVPQIPYKGEDGRWVNSAATFCDWKIRGSTYGGRWEDASDVDDATLVHRAIVAYQTYREEAKERGE